MKLSTVFVQVALVAAGILVYDQVRGSDPIESMGPETPVVRIEAPPPAEAPLPPVVLEGKGVGVLVERQGEFDRRLADLEKRLKSRTVAVTDAGYRPSSTGATDRPEEGKTFVDENGNTRRFGDADVAWFRSLKGEVDAIERRERYVQMFDRQLDRLGVSLTEEQQAKVVDQTIAFRTKVRDAGRDAAGKSQEERKAAMDVLREEYSQTVYTLVSAGDAEKIVESMGRYPGYGFRQGASGRRGGPR